MKFIKFLFKSSLVGLAFFGILKLVEHNQVVDSVVSNEVEVEVVEPAIGDSLCLENIELYLDSIGVHHVEVVMKQAVLETGWLSSYSARERNNLFGLTNGETGQLFKFDNWKESCDGYKNMVQYKYEDMGYSLMDTSNQIYYTFLVDMYYAEDPLYITKLKGIKV